MASFIIGWSIVTVILLTCLTVNAKSEIYCTNGAQTAQLCESDHRKIIQLSCTYPAKLTILDTTVNEHHVQNAATSNDYTEQNAASTSLNRIHCRQIAAFSLLNAKCSSKSSCEIEASQTVFGEPCPGVVRCMRVTFYCYGSLACVPSTNWITPNKNYHVVSSDHSQLSSRGSLQISVHQIQDLIKDSLAKQAEQYFASTKQLAVDVAELKTEMVALNENCENNNKNKYNNNNKDISNVNNVDITKKNNDVDNDEQDKDNDKIIRIQEEDIETTTYHGGIIHDSSTTVAQPSQQSSHDMTEILDSGLDVINVEARASGDDNNSSASNTTVGENNSELNIDKPKPLNSSSLPSVRVDTASDPDKISNKSQTSSVSESGSSLENSEADLRQQNQMLQRSLVEHYGTAGPSVDMSSVSDDQTIKTEYVSDDEPIKIKEEGNEELQLDAKQLSSLFAAIHEHEQDIASNLKNQDINNPYFQQNGNKNR